MRKQYFKIIAAFLLATAIVILSFGCEDQPRTPPPPEYPQQWSPQRQQSPQSQESTYQGDAGEQDQQDLPTSWPEN